MLARRGCFCSPCESEPLTTCAQICTRIGAGMLVLPQQSWSARAYKARSASVFNSYVRVVKKQKGRTRRLLSWISFAREPRHTRLVANDRREFAIAIAKQNKIFKVCGFTYSLRQFFAPVFAQECQCYHRLVVTLLQQSAKRDRVQLASRIRQKAKGTHKASLSLFGGTDGS